MAGRHAVAVTLGARLGSQTWLPCLFRVRGSSKAEIEGKHGVGLFLGGLEIDEDGD